MIPDSRLKSFVKSAISASAVVLGTVVEVSTRQPAAALTFDDGPDPEWTPRILEVLERHGARGTFFMVGQRAARHPELVERVAAGGHALGNHTWSHPSMPLVVGRYRRLQVRWTEEALGRHARRLFRPPYGHQNLASRLDLARLRCQVVTWSIVAEDWRDDPAEVLAARVAARLKPGSIVVFHDSLYTASAERFRDRQPTIGALELLLGGRSDGLAFVTVPELLAMGRPRRWHWYWPSDLAWLKQVS